jgi:hypothetical protein
MGKNPAPGFPPRQGGEITVPMPRPGRSDWFSDTDPRALEVFLGIHRRRTPGEKLAAVIQLTEAAVKLAEAGERLRRPGAGDREIFLRVAARRLGRDLTIAAYGWDPEAHP